MEKESGEKTIYSQKTEQRPIKVKRLQRIINCLVSLCVSHAAVCHRRSPQLSLSFTTEEVKLANLRPELTLTQKETHKHQTCGTNSSECSQIDCERSSLASTIGVTRRCFAERAVPGDESVDRVYERKTLS